MTTVYFVRHAEPNYENHDDMTRELSAKGLSDRKLVTDFLRDKDVDVVLSSPYKRAIDTVKPFANLKGLPIKTDARFRERKVGAGWIEDFTAYSRRQWEDFDYKLPDGESLREVQTRNIAALGETILNDRGKTIVVGSHGTALSTIINHYDSSFGYLEFEKIKDVMPWIVQFLFDGDHVKIQQYDLFELSDIASSRRL